MFIQKETIKLALNDRTLIVIILISMILALILLASSLFQIRPSEVQVPVRYSAYGVTNLYREQWFYLLSFVGSGLLLLILNPLIALKLLQEKSREFALSFALMSVLVSFMGLLLTMAVFRVVSISL